MLILYGASGSGKNTILRYLLSKGFTTGNIVSYTSRPMRKGEVDGVDYHFISREEFEKKIKEEFFAEYVTNYGNYYGISAEDLESVEDNPVTILETEGIKQIKEKGIEVCTVYIEASEYNRRNRMLARGDDEEEVNKRIKDDQEKFKDARYYADIVFSNDLPLTEKRLQTLLLLILMYIEGRK